MPHVEKPKAGKSSLEEKAKQHPDYARWEALAAQAEGRSLEDALEHRAVSPEDLAFMSAKLHFFRRATQQDMSGFGATGEHRRRAQDLARQIGLPVNDVEKIFEEAEAEVDAFYTRFADVWKARHQAEIEMRKLEEQIDAAA